MKFASFEIAGRASYGVVDTETGKIADLGGSWSGQLPTLRDAIGAGALNPTSIGNLLEFDQVAIDAITFLPPIPNPPKILCVGRNYVGHVAEGSDKNLPEWPGLFMRATNTLVAHDGDFVLPKVSDGSFDYEGELAFVIGKAGRYVSKENALDHVFGYSCFNDGSMREFQAKYKTIVGKNFPATGGFGPWIVTTDEIPDPSQLILTTRLNGQQVQHTRTDDLIFDIPTIINFIAMYNPLEPGDLIATGTPDGIGRARTPQLWMKPGDVVEVELSGIGILRNTIVNDPW